MSKISIRFYNDREVRAVWDEDNSKWWFSVLDIVGVLNGQDDYQKNRNYWKYLKTKLKKENNELVSVTNQLKLSAPDGKRRLTDVLDNDGVIQLAKNFSNEEFLEMSKARREEINDISKRTLFLEKLQKQAQLFEGKEIQPLNEPLVEYGQDLPF